MKKFTFSAVATISIYTEVEAETKEAALEEAENRGMQRFCHHCSTGNAGECWSSTGELDGEPCDIRMDEDYG